MPANKRTPFEIERDRTVITQMYLRGATQQEIALDMTAKKRKERYQDTPDLLLTAEQIEDVTYTRELIKYDLAQVRAEWKETRIYELDSARLMELEKLDNLEKTAWDAYDRSMNKKQKTAQFATSSSEGKMIPARGSIVTEEMVGDPKWLLVIYSCIDRRCRLLGLDPPQQRSGSKEDDASTINGELIHAGDAILAKLAQQRASREASANLGDAGRPGESGSSVPLGVLGAPESNLP